MPTVNDWLSWFCGLQQRFSGNGVSVLGPTTKGNNDECVVMSFRPIGWIKYRVMFVLANDRLVVGIDQPIYGGHEMGMYFGSLSPQEKEEIVDYVEHVLYMKEEAAVLFTIKIHWEKRIETEKKSR